MNGRSSSWAASFRQAFEGIVHTIVHERSMRVHLTAAAVVAVAGMWLRLGRDDWLWLGAAICAVFLAELLNTAVERVVDLVSRQQHPAAKAAKDAAAGSVLVAAIFAVAVGLAVLGPPLWRMIS